MASESSERPLKVIFLPFPTPGHMLPMADLAKTLASNGVECIIITTPLNAPSFQTSSNDLHMKIYTLPLPTLTVGLPTSVENLGKITSNDMRRKLFYANSMLREPTEDLIRKLLPIDCIISDMYYPWTSDFAIEIGVPRVLKKASIFNQCCAHTVKAHAPHEQVQNDEDFVTLPSLPHTIVMKKSQLPQWVRNPNEYTRFIEVIREAELKSYGVLANTFCDQVEKEYIEYYTKVTGLKVWNIGPFCLRVNREKEETSKGYSAADDSTTACLRWLDQKEPNSVLYVTFGSLTRFPDNQLREIAAGLEASGHDFIWAVKKKEANEKRIMEENDYYDEWSVEEFRKKMEASNKGLMIVGWAPQMLILEHKAIGGMVTHCGWNTILEGVSIAGVPLVTWPLFAEQFYNERLMVDVLKIGVAVGVSVWCNMDEPAGKEIIGREKVDAAVRAVMGDDKGAVEMRRRAKELREVAQKAVQSGGSSQTNLLAFLDDLRVKRVKREAV